MSYIQASSCDKRRREKKSTLLTEKKKKNGQMTHSNACQRH